MTYLLVKVWLKKKKKSVVNEGLIEKRSEKCRIRIIMQVKKKAD